MPSPQPKPVSFKVPQAFAQAVRWHSRAAEWAGLSDPIEGLRHWQKVRELGRALPDQSSKEACLRACRVVLAAGSWRLGMSEDDVRAVLDQGRVLARELGRPAAVANLLPGVGRWGYSRRVYLLPPILALLIAAARFLIRHLTGGGARVAFVLLLGGSQYLLLSTLWPVHTRQDLLPFYPLFTVLLAGLLLDGSVRIAGAGGSSRWSRVSRIAARIPGVTN